MIIDACLIVKNEENNIENTLFQLCKFTSNVWIVDLGSVDSTINKIEYCRVQNNKIHLFHLNWNNNYSDARNYSISLVENADYVFYCDVSDELSDKFIDQLIEFSHQEYDDNLPDIYSYGTRIKNSFLNNISSVIPRNGLFKSRIHSNIAFKNALNTQIDVNGHSVNSTKFGGHMVTCNIKDNLESRVMYLRYYIETQNNNEKINNEDLFFIAKELKDNGMTYCAFLTFVECIFDENNTKYLCDALLEYIELYRKYKICRQCKSSTIEEIVDHLFEKNILNRQLLFNFADTCLDIGKHELAFKCAEKAYNLKEDLCTPLYQEFVFDEIACIFCLILAADKLHNYRTANAYNEIILEKNPSSKSALYNRTYFADLI